jgi:hypothetical protein
MKIALHNPKFHPGDKVLFLKSEGIVILSTIEYCMFDEVVSQWFYYVTGFHNYLNEDLLTVFNMESGGLALKFTYEY